MKLIKITPDWVLEKLPHTHHVDCSGNISVYTSCATDAHWIELALCSLSIEYDSYDYLDDSDEFVFGFDFKIDDLVSECPSLYKRMRRLERGNKNYQNLSNNYKS